MVMTPNHRAQNIAHTDLSTFSRNDFPNINRIHDNEPPTS